MRILKKSLSLLLAIAMMASFIVVNVSAADEDILVSVDYSKAAIGQGQDIEVTISVTAQKGAAIATSFPAMTVKWNPALASFKEETTDATMGFRTGDGETLAYNNSEGYMDLGAAGLEVSTTKTAVFRCLFTVAADADVAQNFTVTVDEDVTGFANANGDSVPYAVSNSEVDILKAFTVETVTNATSETKSYALGEKTLAQVEEELAAIDFAVEGAAGSAGGEAANLNVTTWTSEPAYDNSVPGTYVFSGNLAGTDVITVPDAKKAVSVTVTVTPLTAGTITSSLESVIEVPAEKIARPVEDRELLALVEDAVYTIGADAYADTITGTAAVTDKATFDITAVDTTATITVTFAASTTSANGKYVLAEAATVVYTVKVVPAEIAGASITIDNATASGKIKVTATLPASELDATVAPHIYGAGYKAVWSDAEAAIVAMKSAMGRADGDTATPNVDNKTMYVGLDKLTPSAVYSIEVLNPDGDAVDLSNTSTSYTAAKDEVVFYWTFSQDNNITLDPPAPNPERAGEDVVDGGTYTIVVYEGEGEAKAEIDRIEVVAGEAEVLGDTPTTYSGTFTLAIDAGTAVLDTHTYEKTFTIGADAEVTVDENGIATVILTADEKLSEILDSDEAGTEFTVSVAYNGAALVVDTTDGGEAVIGEGGKIMVTFNTDVPGIGNSQGNVKVETPAKDDEPGTDEPGTDEPGTDEPGTDEPAAEGPFADVAADHWAASYIATLKDAGIVGGVNDTDFAPDNNITRAEYAKMIAGVFGLEATVAESVFEDCPADAWYTPYVAACTEAGYINGVSETEFAPEALITREQACAILGRALNAVSEGELTFTDAAEVEEYAKANIAALVEMGLVNGYEDGTFAPKNNITRAEAAKIMAGAYAKVAPVEEAPAE